MENIANYDTIHAIINKGLRDENLDRALQAAQLAILDQIRTTLHKMYKYGITVNKE